VDKSNPVQVVADDVDMPLRVVALGQISLTSSFESPTYHSQPVSLNLRPTRRVFNSIEALTPHTLKVTVAQQQENSLNEVMLNEAAELSERTLLK